MSERGNGNLDFARHIERHECVRYLQGRERKKPLSISCLSCPVTDYIQDLEAGLNDKTRAVMIPGLESAPEYDRSMIL